MTPTPAEVARNEAARQAVALAFAVAGAALLIMLQKRLGAGLADIVQADQHDTAGQSRRRMEAAQRSAQRWDRATVWLWRFGPWRVAQAANRRAEAARRAYEAERP